MGKRVSLKDIADKVEVSTALVSYVMNGQEKEKRVSTEMVQKIWEVAKELNYRPDYIAQSLRKGSTNTIGLIVADIANPFFSYIARVVEDETGKYGYTAVFGSSDERSDKFESVINTFLNRRVDGVIVVPAEGTKNYVNDLVKKNFPTVLLDRSFKEINANYVGLDNYGASFDAVTHLVHHGYKRIGMISFKSSLMHMKERVNGYLEAMKSNNLERHIWLQEISRKTLKHEIKKIFTNFVSGKKQVECMLFANNEISVASLYCIQEKKIKIPDELSIIGFDGGEAFDFFYNPVTYIKQPIDLMVKESVRMLIDQINGSSEISQVILKSELIKRKSCCF